MIGTLELDPDNPLPKPGRSGYSRAGWRMKISNGDSSSPSLTATIADGA
jgi:hypothetical protein